MVKCPGGDALPTRKAGNDTPGNNVAEYHRCENSDTLKATRREMFLGAVSTIADGNVENLTAAVRGVNLGTIVEDTEVAVDETCLVGTSSS